MAEWTLLYHNEVIDTSDNGVFSIPADYGVGTEFYIVHHYQEEDEQRIKYVRSKDCCTCKCNQIHRTDVDTSYNYNTEAQNNKLFKELGIDKNFKCYDSLEVFKYSEDNGITEIHYETGGTITIGGVSYTKLQIRGSLSALTDGYKRAMRFGIRVCGNDCNELNPFYVYQRCSCGMDNCKNEYPLEGSTVYEDHPLYIDSCNQDTIGDAICVENLSLVKADYYTREFTTDEDIINNRPSSVSSKENVYHSDAPLLLRNGTNRQSEGTLVTDYIGKSKQLVLHKKQGQNIFGVFTNYATVTESYPLGTALFYVVNTPAIMRVEQVWEITYTTTSDIIIGGSEDGDCTLKTFVVTVYQAPAGWKYNTNKRDKNNKQMLESCT